MIKKSTFFLLLFFTATFALTGQVQVGIGNNTQQKLPFYPAFGYSYGQSIYMASEIGASGSITSIQWYYSGNGNLANSQQLVIYMGHTAKAGFESTTDWIPASALTQVYSGGIATNGAPGWKTITLATPFAYNGTDNLVVATDENQELWDESGDRFYNSPVTGLRSIFIYFDDQDIDPANPPEAYNTVGFVPTVIFGGITQPCPSAYYVNADNITTTGAQLSWQVPITAPAAGSEYYISASPDMPDAATVPTGNIASGASVALEDLVPETVYYVWVRNNCGDGLHSGWSSIYSFKTDCIATADFFEDFDAVAIPELASCWNKILRGSGLSPFARVETTDWYSQSGSNSTVIDTDSSDETFSDVMLVSPRLSSLSAGTHRLKLYLKGHGSLQIGTLTTNDNNAVFTENITAGIEATNTMTEYAVDFSGYTGTDQYIGIRLASPDSAVFIDNVLWETLPSCPDVTAISVPSVSPDGATIEWISGSAEATVSWDVAIGTATDNNPAALAFTNSGDTMASVSGLSENTFYKVWVRTVCSTENGAWIGPVYFQTSCSAITDFYENFSLAVDTDLPGCWRKILAGSGLSEFSTIDITQYSGLFEEGNNAVKLFTDNGSAAEDLMLVSPNLASLPLSTHRLKFYAKHDFTPANVDIVTLSGNTGSATINVIQTVELTGITAQYVIDFTDYGGPDTYIGFRLHAAQAYSSVYIDNILWETIPACPDVTFVTVPETTANTATVTWIPSGEEVSWDVAIGNTTAENADSLSFTNQNDATAIISGLTDNTNYNVWVRSVCAGNDKGAWIGPTAFTTACSPVAAFNENLESAPVPGLPVCWGKIIRGTTVSPFAYIKSSPDSYLPGPTTAIVMNTSDSMQGDEIILVTPPLNNLNLGTYRLKFKAKGAALLHIGTLNANTPTAVFSPLQTITTTQIPTQYEVEFSVYSGTDPFIGIRVDSGIPYSYVEIDDLIWEPIPACPDVTGLQKTGTSMTTAGISWNGTGSQWEMAVGDTTVSDPEALTSTMTTDTAYTFESLTAETTYKIWVRTVCENPLGNGQWAGPLMVTTQCSAVGVPYTEDFESAETPALPGCTSGIKIALAPADWYTSNNPGYGFESNALTYYGDAFTDANSWFFTRGINLTAGESYTVSYRYGGASTDTFFYNNSLKVMYGNQANPADMTLPVTEYLDFGLDAPVADNIVITAPYTGVFYFGFNVISPNNSYYMYIDDIAVNASLSTGDLERDRFRYYPNPVTDVLHLSAAQAITSVSVFNVLGQAVITKSSGNLAEIDLSELSKGTYTARITCGKAVKNIKVIKG